MTIEYLDTTRRDRDKINEAVDAIETTIQHLHVLLSEVTLGGIAHKSLREIIEIMDAAGEDAGIIGKACLYDLGEASDVNRLTGKPNDVRIK